MQRKHLVREVLIKQGWLEPDGSSKYDARNLTIARTYLNRNPHQWELLQSDHPDKSFVLGQSNTIRSITKPGVWTFIRNKVSGRIITIEIARTSLEWGCCPAKDAYEGAKGIIKEVLEDETIHSGTE